MFWSKYWAAGVPGPGTSTLTIGVGWTEITMKKNTGQLTNLATTLTSVKSKGKIRETARDIRRTAHTQKKEATMRKAPETREAAPSCFRAMHTKA